MKAREAAGADIAGGEGGMWVLQGVDAVSHPLHFGLDPFL